MKATHVTCLTFVLLAVAVSVHGGTDFSLDLRDGDDTVCGKLICNVDGVPAGYRLTELSILMIRPAGMDGPSKPVKVNEKRRRLNRMWYGVNVDGTLEDKKASLEFDIGKKKNCLSQFTCTVTIEDDEKNELVQVNHLTQKLEMPEPEEGGELSTALETLQQQIDALSGSVDTSFGDLDGTLTSIHNNVVDSIEDSVSNQLTELENRLSNGGGGADQGTSNMLVEIRDDLGNLETTVGGENAIKANADAIADSTADILKALQDQTDQMTKWQEENVERLTSAVNGAGTCSADDICPALQDDFSEVYNNLHSSIEELKKSVETNTAGMASTVSDAVSSGAVGVSSGSVSGGGGVYACEKGMVSSLSRQVIQPSGVIDVPYMCDTDTDGGGWIVFQHREDATTDFKRDWYDYREGFGTLKTNFWLGNKYLAALTSEGTWELRIDMRWDTRTNRNPRWVYAHYDRFKVASEEDNYELKLGNFDGNITDSFHDSSGREFTTFDRDNDYVEDFNRAVDWTGGGWFGNVWQSNPNGLFGTVNSYYSAAWGTFTHQDSVDFIEMKIRRVE